MGRAKWLRRLKDGREFRSWLKPGAAKGLTRLPEKRGADSDAYENGFVPEAKFA
jgi:hypothetical protein